MRTPRNNRRHSEHRLRAGPDVRSWTERHGGDRRRGDQGRCRGHRQGLRRVGTSVRKDPDGSYDVLGTKAGANVMLDVSADLATITQNSKP
jgi:hypothetical protein